MSGQVQQAVRALALGRLALGGGLIVAPRLATPLVGDAARTPGVRVIVRAMGARDAALGVGTLAAAGDAAQLKRWLVLSSACDAADFAAMLAGPRSPTSYVILVLAASATISGIGLAVAV
jgi:hypothetical protein